MICDVCGGEMQPLFIHAYCPWCEMRAIRPLATDFWGWVIFIGHPSGTEEFVFKTMNDAVLYRDSQRGYEHLPIRPIKSKQNMTWKKVSDPTVGTVWMADRVYEVYENENDCPNNAAYYFD